MGVVYLSEDIRLGRNVALKVLAPELSGHESVRERFVRESRIAASLDHPNVIPIYEAGEVDGVLFMAMRYVEGTDLKALIGREGPLPPERVASIVKQIASALDAAHDRGLVHRDVKPGNILVASAKGTDHAYLTDFGIIKLRESTTRLTRTGQFMGSTVYVAPEQIEKKPLDRRADVYSLGCVLYECLAGGPPFVRDNEAALLYAHLQEPPPKVTRARPELPGGIDEVIARAMAKRPDDRYPSAGELGAACEEALAAGKTSARAGPRVPPRQPQERADGIIGRAAEFSQVTRFIAAVPTGPVALLLEGEAGIGKTALRKETIALASQGSYRVLESKPIESETQLPFIALGDLLDDTLDEVLGLLPEPQARALEVALLRSEAGTSAPDWRAVALGVLGVLRHLARSSPVLVAIDDVQWLDPASARVLEFAIRRLKGEPVGIVTCARPLHGAGVPLGLDTAVSENRLQRLFIGPLGPDALSRMLRSRLGSEFLRPTVQKLHQASGGNPFFALEMAQALLRRGVPLAPGESLPVPENLSELIRERLVSLPPRTRAALAVAAALSQPTVSLVAAALEGDRPKVPPLAEAVEAGIIEIEDGAIRFTHPLFRSVIHAQGTREERRSLHQRLAEVVTDVEESARHLALAADGPTLEVSAALDEAALKARARGAPDAAADLVELALWLTPADRTEDRYRRSLRAAEFQFEAGDTRRARSLLEDALKVLPPGLTRGKALRLLGSIRSYDSMKAAVDLLNEALSEAEGDTTLRAEVERDIAWVSMFSGNMADASVHARAFLSLAEGLQDPHLLAEGLTAVGMTEGLTGSADWPDTLERAVRLAERSEGLHLFRHPSLMYGILLKWADRFEEARSRFESVRRQAVERGDESTLPYVLYHMCELESWAGDWQSAERYAGESYEVAVQTGQDPFQAASLYARALLEARMGRVEAARSAAEEGLMIAERAGDRVRTMQNLHILGFAELSLDRAQESAGYLVRVEDLSNEMGLKEPGAIRFAGDQIEALLGVGDTDRARWLLEDLEERGRTLRRAWALAVAARCRGLLEATLGQPGDAVASLQTALTEHQGLSDPFELGRTLLVLGIVERQAENQHAARRALEQAQTIFDRLGAALYSEKAAAELAR